MDRRTRRELLSRLTADAQAIAMQFALEYRALEAERSNVTSRYGICYDDGTIKIRLNHSLTGEPLKYSSLVNTLCHELAHLRHFNHGPRFKAFYLQLLGWSREKQIYQPRSSEPKRPARTQAPMQPEPPIAREPRPVQLDLFG
jgi:predicted metal-dependent hydrolase